MKGYKRFGLLLGILGVGALLSAGIGVRAADEKPKEDKAAKDKVVVQDKVVKKSRAGTPDNRVFEKRIELGGGGGFLGVAIEDVDKDDLAALKLSEERGVVVKSVEADSAASRAGLKEGDVILRYQGETVWSAAQFRRLIRETPAGRMVSLDVSNAGAARTVSATLADRPSPRWTAGMPALADLEEGLGPLEDFTFEAPEPPEPPDVPDVPEAPDAPDAPRPPRIQKDRMFRFRMPGAGRLMWRGGMFAGGGQRKLGIEYQPVSGQLAKYFKVEGEGILVTSVDEGGPAALGGVKAGDVIVKVNGKAVEGSGELHEALESIDAGQEVSLTVQRDGRPVDVKVKAGGRKSEGPAETT